MKVVVFGSTGGVGSQVVKQAIEKGYLVTAFARNPDRVSFVHHNLTVVQGDCYDYQSVENAVKGQQVVISCIGSRNYQKNDKVTSVGTKNIIDAMKKFGLKKLISISSVGIGSFRENNLVVNLVIRPYFALYYKEIVHDLEVMEKEIKESGLDWVIVRPSFLTNGKQRGIYHTSTDTKEARLMISRSDVADFMVKQIENNEDVGKIATIGYKLLGFI